MTEPAVVEIASTVANTIDLSQQSPASKHNKVAKQNITIPNRQFVDSMIFDKVNARNRDIVSKPSNQ
jgi:hypothetical protein